MFEESGELDLSRRLHTNTES